LKGAPIGRPRLGEQPLTKTERQRRWRAKRRLEQAGSDTRSAVRSIEPIEPDATDSIGLGEGPLAEVMGERDERQQLDQLRHNVVALGELCFGCGKREDEVGVMFGSSRGSVRMCVCDLCIDRLSGKLREIRQAQPAAQESTP
jgi:hypothetical protein